MTGLVAWWPLADSSGGVPDLSGNGNDGSISGVTQGVAGKGGLTGHSFNGSSDFISVSHSSELNPDYITVSAWIRPNTIGSFDRIFAKDSSGQAYQFLLDSGGLGFRVWVSGSARGNLSFGTVQTNEWTHVAGTYDGSDVKGYIDGTEFQLDTATGPMDDDNGTLYIGQRDVGSSLFDGVMSDLRIYNRALSASEIQTLYEWGAAGLGSIPEQDEGGISYYKLDGSATDSWGDNNGTINGATEDSDGIRNSSYVFDGDNDYITIPYDSTIDFDSADFSVSVWVKTNTSTNGRILHQGNATGTWWSINYNNTSNVVQFFFDDGSDTAVVETDIANVSDSEWHHLAFSFIRGNTLIAFLDRISIGSADISAINGISNSDPLEIGADPDSGIYFDGRIDELRIYDRALGGDEVRALYNYDDGGNLLGELANPPTDMLAHYEFKGDATDSAGDNDGTVNGAVFVSNAGPHGEGVYLFDGTDDEIDLDSVPLTGNTNRTVSGWFNRQGSGSSGQHTIAYWGDGSNGGDWRCTVEETDKVAVRVTNGNIIYDAPGATTSGEWNHFVFVLDGNSTSDVTFYMNGSKLASKVSESSQTISTGSAEGASLGYERRRSVSYLDGYLGDVRIYDRALSQREISQLYRYGTLGRDMRELTVNAR